MLDTLGSTTTSIDMMMNVSRAASDQTARALLLATALLGAIVAVVRGTTILMVSYYDASSEEDLWVALLTQNLANGSVHTTHTRRTPTTTSNYSSTPASYAWNISTQENYQSKDDNRNYGRYVYFRNELDRKFHSTYTKSRQLFQDSIIDSMLLDHDDHDDKHDQSCPRPQKPWIIFTAGAMGAGKSHTVNRLDQEGRFPLHSFVTVDPDRIRQELPEFHGYVKRNPEKAGELTRKECGMIAEIVIKVALHRGRNVLVDGTLRNASWYRDYIRDLRDTHPNLRIAIFHITAPREAVFARALSRSKITGRVVPTDLLEQTMLQVPKSVACLKKSVDFKIELHNAGNGELKIVDDSMDWNAFRAHWSQVC